MIFYPLQNPSAVANFFTGSGDPSTFSGQENGNMYLDVASGTLWQLQSGTWVPIANTGNQIAGSNGDIIYNDNGEFGASSDISLTGTITEYAGVPTVAAGVGSFIGKSDLTNQTADFGPTAVLASTPKIGFYRVLVSLGVVTPGSVSGTLPAVSVSWTDGHTNQVCTVALTATKTGNSTSTAAAGVAVIFANQSYAISYSSSGYASSGTAMKFAASARCEYLG